METLKQLRARTGAGITDCKKALDEANGDAEKAVEILRKKGIAKAAKRCGRDATEGIIKVAVNEAGNEGYILEVNSETDFVARNKQFQEFVDNILTIVKEQKPANLEALFALTMNTTTVGEELENLSGVIGEKLVINRFEILAGETVASYLHMGGNMGILVSLDKADQKELAYNIAMHIGAANPRYINPEDVDSAELEKEKEIYREQLIKKGKPENIIEKILEGKISKYYGEVCLTKQEYIKDDKKKVEDILGETKVINFIRYSLA